MVISLKSSRSAGRHNSRLFQMQPLQVPPIQKYEIKEEHTDSQIIDLLFSLLFLIIQMAVNILNERY